MNRTYLAKWRQNIDQFFFKPANPAPLGALRIALVAMLLVQAFFLKDSVLDFFSSTGFIQGSLAEYLGDPLTPHLSWLTSWLVPKGFNEAAILYSVCGVYVLSLLFLGLGFKTRIAAVTTWFLHWTLMNTGYTMNYGVDLYTHVFLFYLMFAPCGDAYSLDVLLGTRKHETSSAARLALRIMQLQLCITYLASSIEKASGAQWWNGELLWRAFSLPVYHQFDMTWLAYVPWLSKIAGWTTLLFEGGYTFFIWPRLTRKIWIALAVALHLGIAIFLNLSLFGVVMCLLTVTIFGVSSEPKVELETNAEYAPKLATA